MAEPIFCCIFCQNDKPIFYQPVFGPEHILNGEAAAHFYETHGFDSETFINMYWTVMKKAVISNPDIPGWIISKRSSNV